MFSSVNFCGLKLNRVNHLKTQLNLLNINKSAKDCMFRIRITVKDETVESLPFKIVSSFSQLSTEFQAKRQARSK